MTDFPSTNSTRRTDTCIQIMRMTDAAECVQNPRNTADSHTVHMWWDGGSGGSHGRTQMYKPMRYSIIRRPSGWTTSPMETCPLDRPADWSPVLTVSTPSPMQLLLSRAVRGVPLWSHDTWRAWCERDRVAGRATLTNLNLPLARSSIARRQTVREWNRRRPATRAPSSSVIKRHRGPFRQPTGFGRVFRRPCARVPVGPVKK